MPVFSSFLVVAASASQAVAKRCIVRSLGSRGLKKAGLGPGNSSRGLDLASRQSHPKRPGCVTLEAASCPCQEHLILVRSLRNYLRFLAAVQLLPALESEIG